MVLFKIHQRFRVTFATNCAFPLNFVDCRHFIDTRPIKKQKINLVTEGKFFRLGLITQTILMT